MSTMTVIPQLPTELVSYILGCLPADDTDSLSILTLLACSLVSSTWHGIARQSSIWSRHLTLKWRKGVSSTTRADAFAMYKYRTELDREAVRLIYELARSSNDRIAPMERIKAWGDLVYERLQQLMLTTEEQDPHSWLSVRYWAREATHMILRESARQVWTELVTAGENGDGHEEEDAFERGVAAFCAFRGKDPKEVRVCPPFALSSKT